MRLSNRKKAPIYNFLLTFSLLFAIIGGAMTFLNIIKLPVFGKMASISLLLIGGAGLVIIFLRGRQIFPKYKLVSFEIVNALLFKRLYIKITSKKHKESILKYDISYLTSSEIRDLKLSLQRTIKANKENTDNEK